MRYRRFLATRWPLLVALAATLGALALLIRTRTGPLDAGALGQIDALSAFFAFATLSGVAVARAGQPASPRSWRVLACGVALLAAYGTSFTLVLAGGHIAAALLAYIPFSRPRRPPSLGAAARSAAGAAPGIIVASCVALGYGALALRGATRYDAPGTVAALDSFVFWFVLLGSAVALWDFGLGLWRDDTAKPSSPKPQAPGLSLLAIAWLYPLARLYSLGPWNTGWSFAAMLFGGALAGWGALSALAHPRALARRQRELASFAGLALAALGLGTSAGLTAACFGALAYVLLAASTFADDAQETRRQGDKEREDVPISSSGGLLVSNAGWLLTTAFPFTAPFVAAWMLMGAAVAGGVALLAGLAWLVALVLGLAAALWSPPGAGDSRPRLLPAALSLALGIGAPLVVLWLIQPVVQQLQGGLTPYGDVNIWPWIGLAASDAAHTQVTTLPSIAIALLMLVLCALVYVVARLRGASGSSTPQSGASDASDPALDRAADPDVQTELLRELRAEVPWLDLLMGGERERRRGDTE